MTMAYVTMATDGVALTLIERHGRSARIYVDEQVRGALRAADWRQVKAWRGIGSNVEKLLRAQFYIASTVHLNGYRSALSH